MNSLEALSYFEELKKNPDAIKISVEALFKGSLNDESKFLYLNIIELNLTKGYSKDSEIFYLIRTFIFQWIKYSVMDFNKNYNASPKYLEFLYDPEPLEKCYILNKFAQIFAKVSVNTNENKESNIIEELMHLISPYVNISIQDFHTKISGNNGLHYVFEVKYIIDLYLRILKAIHMEIADRSIPSTQMDIQRNAAVKDYIREKCAVSLINSIFQIVILYKENIPPLCMSAFQVLGMYSSWLDINLTANGAFLDIILTLMSPQPEFKMKDQLCQSALTALNDILNKKMEPWPKVEFLEGLYQTICHRDGQPPGKLLLFTLNGDGNVVEDVDVIAKKGKLISTFGTLLISSWTRLIKSSASDRAEMTYNMIISKFDLLLQYLNCPNDKISTTVLPFANDLVIVLFKQAPAIYKTDLMPYLQGLLSAIITKLKFPTNLSMDNVMDNNIYTKIQENRRDWKLLFENISTINFQMVLLIVHQLCTSVLKEWWNHTVQDVELCLTLINFISDSYNTFKSITPRNTNHLKKLNGNEITEVQQINGVISEIMNTMMYNRIDEHPQPIIQLSYFENINQFYRYFAKNPKYIPIILKSFQSERGIMNKDTKIRERCLHIYCRLIKNLKSQIIPHSLDILLYMEQIINQAGLGTVSTSKDSFKREELNALYEAYSSLVISADLPLQKKKEIMEKLLSPLMAKFQGCIQSLHSMGTLENKEAEGVVSQMNSIIYYIIRTTKAFSAHVTMKQTNVESIYIYILELLLKSLDTDFGKDSELSLKLGYQSLVRQYFHVMVVCLDDEIIPYIPIAFQKFMLQCDFKSVQELIPLINQITSKFKKDAIPLLNVLFMPLVTTIYTLINNPFDTEDPHECRERKNLQRSYYSFLINIIHQNNMLDVICGQGEENMKVIIQTVVQGALDFSDPTIQKSCFTLFRKFIDSWMPKDGGGSVEFKHFVYTSILPACFSAPMSPTFDLNDAQTIQALNECATCIQLIHRKGGAEFERVLIEFFPTINLIDPYEQNKFIGALKLDTKQFKTYYKEFLTKLR